MEEDARVMRIYQNAREDLCRSIASLDKSCNDDHVQSVLEPIITGVVNAFNDDFSVPKGNTFDEADVTPLMVACNRGSTACLKYFQSLYENQKRDERGKKAIDHLVGDCLHSCQADGNNQAIHYAISIPEALDHLANILSSQRRKDGSKKAKAISLGEACLALLSQNNDHGDTPFMMAAAIGMKLTIETWIQIAMSYSLKSNDCKNTIKELLYRTNNGKDTALSLAGHGHHEVLEYLTFNADSSTSPLVQVTYDDIQRVKEIVNKMNDIKGKVPIDRTEEFKRRQSSVRRCLDLLQVASTKHAENMSKLLLSEANHSSIVTRTADLPMALHSKQSKKKKKKAVTKASSQFDKTPTIRDNNDDLIRPSDNLGAKETVVEFLSKPKFLTMEDGTMISDTPQAVKRSQPITLPASIGKDQKSIEILLKERCDDTLCQQSKELMDALCLDASMLLLSPHSLAMNLSPCQLEAVETVLKNQLDAVSQAKNIHSRLMAENEELLASNVHKKN